MVNKDYNFSYAIDALKYGILMTRRVWQNQSFIWLKKEAIIDESWCKDPVLKRIAHDKGGKTKGLGTICMKTKDGSIMTGWTPSQEDMLADDWCEWYDDLLGPKGPYGGEYPDDSKLMSLSHHYLNRCEMNCYLTAKEEEELYKIHGLIENYENNL